MFVKAKEIVLMVINGNIRRNKYDMERNYLYVFR